MKFWVDIEKGGEIERYRELCYIYENYSTSFDGIYCIENQLYDFKNSIVNLAATMEQFLGKKPQHATLPF